MMATTPVFSWPIPNLGELPNGPEDISELAQAIENTYGSSAYQSYTPTLLASAGSVAFSNSNGTALGRYRVWQGWCDLVVFITFGSAVNGGTNDLRLTLPLPGAPSNVPPQCWMTARLYTPSHGHWSGMLYIPSGGSIGYPRFPYGPGNSKATGLQNADSTNAVSTGVPQTPGSKTIQSGGQFTVNGRYRVV